MKRWILNVLGIQYTRSFGSNRVIVTGFEDMRKLFGVFDDNRVVCGAEHCCSRFSSKLEE